MKSFISSVNNTYYEAIDRIGPNDIEVPQRPSIDHVFMNGSWIHKSFLQNPHAPIQMPIAQPIQQVPGHQMPQHQTSNAGTNLNDLVGLIKQMQTTSSAEKEKPLLGEKFNWKDLITILYFAGGIVGLWMHMNERIIILEQKVVSIEKGSAELQASFKEFTVENKNQLKNIDSKISDLQQMVITRLSSKDKN